MRSYDQSNKQHKSGFSIVEMMVALALAAVLLGFALPAFDALLQQRTMTTRINDFVLAVHYARSEAVKTGGVASVVAENPVDDDEWGGGFCVVLDAPDDCDGATLREFIGFDDMTLMGTGVLEDVDTISFNSRGLFTLDGDGTLQLCSTDDAVNPGREISINNIGRTTVAELVCVDP